MNRKIILFIVIFILVPSYTFGNDDFINTGYDLYEAVKLVHRENKNVEEILASNHTLGYLKGFIDGIVLMRDFLFTSMFPPEIFSDREIDKISKEMNVHRLNLPEEGLATGQIALIYKNYAERHPEELTGTARACLLSSLIDAYGWK